MSGGKGGSSTTEIKLPEELERAAEDNLKIADEVAAIGYTPYTGPTQAGFTPMQMAGFQNINNAANAFGMGSVGMGPMQHGGATGGGDKGGGTRSFMDRLAGSSPNASAMGFSAYSPHAMYQNSIGAIPAPQRTMIESFVNNPITGAPPQNPAVPRPQLKVDASGKVVKPPKKTKKDEQSETDRILAIMREEEQRKRREANEREGD